MADVPAGRGDGEERGDRGSAAGAAMSDTV